MIIEISNQELFGITKRQIKLKIVKVLQQALDTKFEKIRALRDNDVELEKYAHAYYTLKVTHSSFQELEEDKNFPEFQSLYMNEQCFVRLKESGVDKSCISDLQFYLKLLDDELNESVTFNSVGARVTQNGLEMKSKLCVNGYCYESDGKSEWQQSNPQSFNEVNRSAALQTRALFKE